ncbi:MAG: serine aminopeptidase domain-containing protein [Methanobacteriaceae archaeon]
MNQLSFEDLEVLAQTFVAKLLKADFATAADLFDEQMKTLFPEVKLKESVQRFFGEAGNFLELKITRTAELESYRIVFIRSQFERAVIDVQVVFDIQGQISGLNFIPLQTVYNPPAYVDQSTFEDIDVTVGSGLWELPGTLSIPHGSGPFPGVVLVHGSGPQDRDETIGPNKIFRDLAWGLASQNIAVLRYDKRTLKHASKFTPEMVAKTTVKEEVLDDALSAILLMRQRDEIDPKHIFMLGHSLGGFLAPRIGQQNPNLAGLIIMAGITRSLEDTILEQFTYLYSQTGNMTEQQKKELESLKVKVATVKDPMLSDKTSTKDLPLGVSAAYWLDLRSYQPTNVAKSLTIPILILQGGRDYQVLPTKDFEGWKTALKSKKIVSFKLYPKLNHLFIAGEGKITPQEYAIEGHVSKEVIDNIKEWITN